MGSWASEDNFSRTSSRSGASRATVTTSLDRRQPLHLSASGLRGKLAVIVVVAVALSGLLPDSLAADLSRYSVPDDRLSMQSDRIADLLRFINKRRSAQCVETKQQCFSSSQCCSNHVCVIDDDYLANDPETPGACVREKDLTLCSVSSDCPLPRSRCVSLGRTGQRYCVSSSPSRRTKVASPEPALLLNKNGKLGSACASSFDCDEKTNDGLSAMCCQLVNMHRQGTRQVCDRYRPVSICI